MKAYVGNAVLSYFKEGEGGGGEERQRAARNYGQEAIRCTATISQLGMYGSVMDRLASGMKAQNL